MVKAPGNRRKISEIRKKENKNRQRRRVYWIVILAAITLYFISGDRGTIQLIRFYKHKLSVEKEIEQLQKKKNELEKVKDKLENDPDYIEKIAREKYKMKKKGEKVYQVEEK